jgi:hypothetical protein
MRRVTAPLALLSLLLTAAAPVSAQQPAQEDWPRVKCERYQKATAEALRRFGTAGLGQDFLARHEAFLAAGCQGERNVCPKTEAEFRLANALVIQGMNAGMASTFFPFGCPKSP